MAFMSLTAFADNIVIVPTVIDKTYGEDDPGSEYGGYAALDNPNGVKTTMFYVASPTVLPDGVTAEKIAKCLKVIRVANSTGEAVGSYKYLFQVNLEQDVALSGHQIIVQSNGDLNITKGEAEITGLALAGWTYGEDPNVPSCTSKAGTVTVPVSYLYANGNDPEAVGYAEGEYATIVKGQAGHYYVKATVAETDNYEGATAYAAFSIGQKAITAPTFGQNAFTIIYGESAPDFGLTFTEDDLVNEDDAAQFVVVEEGHDALPTAAKDGAYTVKVVDNSGNYSFVSETAEYTINFKAIDADGIAIQNADALPSKEYKAAAWELTVVDDDTDPENVISAELIVMDGTKRLVAGTDYEVAYANNTNVSEDGATVTITGIGNYATNETHKLTANFAITPATLNVALAEPAQNISYGGVWDNTVVIPDADWKSDADKTAFDAANLPTAAITGEEDYDEAENLTAGEHIVTISGGTAPDNYVFNIADDNTVTVGKAIITISLKTDATTEDLQWNGTATAGDLANALAHAYKLSVDLDPEAVFSVQPTVVSTAAEAANYAPNSYAIAFQAHDAVIASAFADKYTLAWDDTPQNFTIKKKDLTITALNQAVAKVADAEDSEYNGEAVYGVTYTIDGFAEGESAEDLENASLDLTALILTLTNADVKTAGGTTPITPSGAVSDFYDIEFVAGTLTVAGDGIALTLPFTDEAKAIIAAADGSEDVEVTFDGTREWLADEWYTVVLPFEVTAQELVEKLHTYVVVNRLSSSSSEDHIAFKLEMKSIPAGEAFLMKTADNIDWDGVSFDDKTISKDIYDFTDDEDNDVAAGNKLVGVYETTMIKATTEQEVGWIGHTNQFKADGVTPRVNKWYVPASAEKAIDPFDAYLVYAQSSIPAANRLITVEDIDGTVTAISEVSAGRFQEIKTDGWYTLGGVKLQGAPTQKGIYINNGKKIVVK